jgi:tRNA A-37 threonylcarbamoyl transferase component Bud32/TolB-like protein
VPDTSPAVEPRWEAIERLLDRALELTPDEQEALLRRAGSDDPALEAAVRRLLEAGRRAGTFLERPAALYAGPLLAWAAGGEPLAPGAPLGGYEIVRRLGRGATATVYLARDPKHRRTVAVKVLHPDLAAAVGAERFLREIEIAATLQHPHILPLFDSGRAPAPSGQGDLLYYVMPHVEGESLRQMLAARGRLPLETALRIAREVAGALDYSHRRGVVHRDIKPENILLQDGQAIVADFGIARALDAAGAEQSGEPAFGTGTPAYMSPEQSRAEAVDGRTDIYALGCVLYEMLAGAPPFTGSPVEVRRRHLLEAPPDPPADASLPAAVERAVRRALAKDRADRFPTAGTFADALGDAPAGPRRVRVRRRARVLIGAGAMAAAGVGAAMLRAGGAAVTPVAARIAVLPFQPALEDSTLARVGEDLAATVNVTLDRLGGITTVDRFATLTRTADVRRSRSAEDAVTLGRRFGAGSVLVGTIARAGDDVRVEATLVRSDRPVPIARAAVVAPAESLAVITDSLTLQLVRQVWLRRTPPTPSLAAVTTRSVSALRSFLDGERAMLAARWREAADDYHAASTADSGFTLAYARYAEAVTWRRDDHVYDVDSTVRRHLSAGRMELPARDRLLVDARLAGDSSSALRLGLLGEAVRRYPDYWPGWLAYGDALVHFGLLHGHSWAEAKVALRRALAGNPDIVSAWEHLQWVTAGTDPATYREAVEQRIRLGSYAGADGARALRAERLMIGVQENQDTIRGNLGPLADSVARDRAALPFEGFRWGVIGELGFGFPAMQIDLDRRMLKQPLTLDKQAEAMRSLALSWAARGAWDSALADLDRFVALGASPSAPSHAYSLTLLGAFLGALEPSAVEPRRVAAHAALPGLPADIRPIREVCLYWLDGILAYLRHDPARLTQARSALAALNTSEGNENAAILSAFALALDGRRAEAGRRVARLEFRVADSLGLDLSRYDILITRMSAARWLAEAGDTGLAVGLLRAVNVTGAGKRADDYVAAGWAQLQLARLLVARGDTAGAVEAYRQFLRRVDLPEPRLRPQVDGAKAALAKLDGRNVS